MIKIYRTFVARNAIRIGVVMLSATLAAGAAAGQAPEDRRHREPCAAPGSPDYARCKEAEKRHRDREVWRMVEDGQIAAANARDNIAMIRENKMRREEYKRWKRDRDQDGNRDRDDR